MRSSTELSTEKQRRGYSPQQTADVRTAQVSAVLRMTQGLTKKAPVHVDLHDENAVKETLEQYQTACADCGIMPSIEGAAAQLGVSRRWIYAFLEEHADEPSARYIDRKRLEWAACRIALAERGVLDPTTVIFLTLNSSLGFTNKHDLMVETQQNTPLGNVSDEEARKIRQKYLDALPDE